MAKDYYQILGVSRNASEDEIKKKYRQLAMQYHPDRNPGKEKWANDKFKEINEAFSVLGDPDKRRKYDQFGTAEGIDIGDIFRSSSTRSGFEDLMKDFGGEGLGFGFLDDIFKDFLGGRGFSFRNFSSGPGGRIRFERGGPGGIRFETGPGERINLDEIFGRAQRTEPVRYELFLTSEEIARGTEKFLTRKGHRLLVKIPAGAKTVKLTNAQQVTDGQPGDILIQIKVQ